MTLPTSKLDFSKVDRLRAKLGFTTEQMATLLGATRMSYYRWVNGHSAVSQKKYRMVSHRLRSLKDIVAVSEDLSFSSVKEKMADKIMDYLTQQQ